MTKDRVVETTFRVRYAETDAMGVVYHTNYLIWFEVGRGEFMRQKGGNYADFEAQGFYLPVSEVDARFIAPARYGDLIIIRTWTARQGDSQEDEGIAGGRMTLFEPSQFAREEGGGHGI